MNKIKVSHNDFSKAFSSGTPFKKVFPGGKIQRHDDGYIIEVQTEEEYDFLLEEYFPKSVPNEVAV